jgi:hypothetical protein
VANAVINMPPFRQYEALKREGTVHQVFSSAAASPPG